MPGFDEAWAFVSQPRDGEEVSRRLRPLLDAVYRQVLAKPLSLIELKKNLEDLLLFLGGEGRTNANCWAVGLFFCLSERWEADWGAYPSPRRSPKVTFIALRHDMWNYKPPVKESDPLHAHIDAFWNVLRKHKQYLLSLIKYRDNRCFLTSRSNCDHAGVVVRHESLEMFRELEIPLGLSIIVV